MTLSMSNLLEYRDGYLYSSAYHYWNHFSEISQHNLTRTLVFVDLDSFEIQRLIPLSLIQPDNSPYQIPVLDIRNPIILDDVYKPAEIYNNICRDVAIRILQRQFPSLANYDETITHLSHYLQKISFFQRIQPYITQESLTFIVEIWWQGDIFYKQVTLPVATVANVVFQKINATALRKVATQHADCQFVLISQYNIFNIQLQRLLPEYICLQPRCQEFSRMWSERNNLSFPLFAIYLDEIEFAIGMGDSTQWIQLSSQESTISYEGEPILLRGRIPTTNRDYFLISQGSTARLPIRVNGSEYCRDGVPQQYSIEIQNYQGTEDVRVSIEFQLQPGSLPDLRVKDLEGQYQITAALRDRLQQSLSYSYLPSYRINNTRAQKSSEQINRLTSRLDDLEKLGSYLSQLSEALDNTSSSYINYRQLIDLLESAYREVHAKPIRKSDGRRIKIDLLQFINASAEDLVVIKLRSAFQHSSLSQIVNIIGELLNSSLLTDTQQELLITAIKFTGKTYKFSQKLSVENLFFQVLINKARRLRISGDPGNEYLQCIARVATHENLQRQYFQWFDSYYTESKYMWGYGRILFWYYNFDTSTEILNYRKHFTALLQHLLARNPNKDYKQNAFLALLYLLTFRARDPAFCQSGSNEMELAERVIEYFRGERIILTQVNTEKSLNEFFQEMIEGTITETDVDNLLRAD